MNRSRKPSTATTSMVASAAPPNADSALYWRRLIRFWSIKIGTTSRSPPVLARVSTASPSVVRHSTQMSTGGPDINRRNCPVGAERDDSNRPRAPTSIATLSVVKAAATGSGVIHNFSMDRPFPWRSSTEITVCFLGSRRMLELSPDSVSCSSNILGRVSTRVLSSGSISSTTSPWAMTVQEPGTTTALQRPSVPVVPSTTARLSLERSNSLAPATGFPTSSRTSTEMGRSLNFSRTHSSRSRSSAIALASLALSADRPGSRTLSTESRSSPSSSSISTISARSLGRWETTCRFARWR